MTAPSITPEQARAAIDPLNKLARALRQFDKSKRWLHTEDRLLLAEFHFRTLAAALGYALVRKDTP